MDLPSFLVQYYQNWLNEMDERAQHIFGGWLESPGRRGLSWQAKLHSSFEDDTFGVRYFVEDLEEMDSDPADAMYNALWSSAVKPKPLFTFQPSAWRVWVEPDNWQHEPDNDGGV